MSVPLSSRAPLAVRTGSLARGVPAWTITAAMGLVYVITAPSSADLAAASYRSNLFGRAGFTLWDNGWYGGHHLPAYSVFAPALGWLIGPLVLAAVSMTIAAALFAALIEGRFPAPAVRIAAAGSRSGPASGCWPAACRSTWAWPSGWGRCCWPSAIGACPRSCSPCCARSRAPWPERSSRWRRSPGRSAGARGGPR